MHLLIPLRHLPKLINPQRRVPHLSRRHRPGLVHADVDRQARAPRRGLQAEDERAGGYGLDEGEGFRGGGGDVVCCFGEEEGLWWGRGVRDWVVGEEGGVRNWVLG